ncbi:unnamed protein product, partial [Brassica oleracea]
SHQRECSNPSRAIKDMKSDASCRKFKTATGLVCDCDFYKISNAIWEMVLSYSSFPMRGSIFI